MAGHYEHFGPVLPKMTKLSLPRHFWVIHVKVASLMRLLVVEDEPRILSFLVRGLESEGFAVDSERDGASALRRAALSRYDLVVLDLLLPRLDGLSVLRELQQRRPGMPVVILSARADLQTKLRGFELGASDYVSKPFALDELIARIRAHIRHFGAGSDDGQVLEAGPLALDLARRQVRIGELVADLSDREFKLLHQLVRHAGEVVSRERLLSEVWGYHFDPCSNVVDVCVRRLRKKLGSDAPIETVRNAGYRLAS
jgi:two-component system, OmpR family, copper resistance phosphate regulon response regulator CusR